MVNSNEAEKSGELATSRECLRPPIPELAIAAIYLDDAVSAHISGKSGVAEELITRSNLPAIREWTESLWGKRSPYVLFRSVVQEQPVLAVVVREELRMPSSDEKRQLHLRDGYHCRFCGIPVIRKEIRTFLRTYYPIALPWGRTNVSQHAAFQAMWAQYDHIVPHAHGGKNDLENIVLTCAPCNFGRMNYTLEEVGLADPRKREPVRSTWDGLERLLKT